MHRRNCWEVNNCGRQTGGSQVAALGECPAASTFACHRVNNGINGGRACWAIAGTMCDGEVQASVVDKIKGCANCDFFHQVAAEERDGLATTPEILKRIRN